MSVRVGINGFGRTYLRAALERAEAVTDDVAPATSSVTQLPASSTRP